MPILDRNRFLRPAEDVLRRCRPVLVRISPGYPSVKGRLHTCYSPVRRSPAEESKLSSPLPLDLHVLSLSLAFILSQDQTLRCWLSFFIFFLFLKRSKKATSFLVCCCLHGHPAFRRRATRPTLTESVVYAGLKILTRVHVASICFQTEAPCSLTCTTSSIARISMFYVAPLWSRKRLQSYGIFSDRQKVCYCFNNFLLFAAPPGRPFQKRVQR